MRACVRVCVCVCVCVCVRACVLCTYVRVCVCVSPSQAISRKVIIVKFGTVTASDTIMHHVVLGAENHARGKCGQKHRQKMITVSLVSQILCNIGMNIIYTYKLRGRSIIWWETEWLGW